MPWNGAGLQPGEQLEAGSDPEDEPGGYEENWLVDGLGKGERGVGGVCADDW